MEPSFIFDYESDSFIFDYFGMWEEDYKEGLYMVVIEKIFW